MLVSTRGKTYVIPRKSPTSESAKVKDRTNPRRSLITTGLFFTYRTKTIKFSTRTTAAMIVTAKNIWCDILIFCMKRSTSKGNVVFDCIVQLNMFIVIFLMLSCFEIDNQLPFTPSLSAQPKAKQFPNWMVYILKKQQPSVRGIDSIWHFK